MCKQLYKKCFVQFNCLDWLIFMISLWWWSPQLNYFVIQISTLGVWQRMLVSYCTIAHSYDKYNCTSFIMININAIIRRELAQCHETYFNFRTYSVDLVVVCLFLSYLSARWRLQYVLQVLELLKNESTGWQYQGTRMIDSTQCNVWSYPIHDSWIAEIAFSVYVLLDCFVLESIKSLYYI